MERFEKALTSIADGYLHDFGIGTGTADAFCRSPIGFDRRHATLERIDCNDYLADILHLPLMLLQFTSPPLPLACDSHR